MKLNSVSHPVIFLRTIPGRASFVDRFCHLCLSLVTHLGKANLLELLFVMFFLCFCYFPLRCPWSGLVHDCTEIFMFESVDTRAAALVPSYKLTGSLRLRRAKK